MEAQSHIHHHHSHAITSLNGIYVTAIVLNILFVAVEAGIGFLSDSIGLLSDAGHNLSDVFSLLLAMLAFRLSSSRPTKRFTYGYRKTSVLISFLNAIILLVAVGAIIVESIRKFNAPAPVSGAVISWTAAAGILVNGITAIMLMKRQKHDINTKGAYLHMLTDTLVSAGVVVSGVIISITGFSVIDPIIGLAIAGVILLSTWNLLAESFRMSIDAVPAGIDTDEIRSEILQESGVKDIHHLHVWPISTTETALTAHVVISDLQQMESVKDNLRHRLLKLGIQHSTLEIESLSSRCHETECRCGGSAD